MVFIGTKKLTGLESDKAGAAVVNDDCFYHDAVRMAHLCSGIDVVSDPPTVVQQKVDKRVSFESLDISEYPRLGATSPTTVKVDSPVVTDETVTELFAQVTPTSTPTSDTSKKRVVTGASGHLTNTLSRLIKEKLIKVGRLHNCLPAHPNLKPEFRFMPQSTRGIRPFLFTLETERMYEGSSERTLSLTFECDTARSLASAALANSPKHKSYVYPAYINFANLEPEVDGSANITVPRKLWVKKSSDPKEMTKAIELVAAGSQDVWDGLADGDKQKLTAFARCALKAILEVKESLTE
jgi:hypothetical protein